MTEDKQSVFNDLANLYHSSRPSYPEELITDLIDTACLKPDSRILEIGVGTGKLTELLANRGLDVTGVELGDRMAGFARKLLTDSGNVKIIVGDFDNLELPGQTFDLVVSATAYHWLDKRTRVERIRKFLDDDGIVAVIDTVHLKSVMDDFTEQSQKCYAKWDPNSTGEYSHPTLEESKIQGFRRKNEFEGGFSTILDKSYFSNIEYDSCGYIKLLQTYSDVIMMPDSNRKGLLDCIDDLINEKFHGRITKSYLWQLFIARKRDEKSA